MNKIRRKEIQKIYALIEEAQERLALVREEEEEYMDNMPENLQGSERYETAEQAVGDLEDAVDALDTALDLLDSWREGQQ